jgi:hypothetical protein
VRFGLLTVGPTVAVGLVAALVTISARDADPAFVYAQQHPARLEPAQLESILVRTREPVPSGTGSRARSVQCLPGHSGPKLNPWRCTIRYRSGHAIDYRIVVEPSGRFRGFDRTGARLVQGCCLRGGGLPGA